MRFAIIKVRDNHSGYEHILGTNSHDMLEIDGETGGLHYMNLQNSDGTGEGGSYTFQGEEDEFSPDGRVEFVSFDELLEIYKQNITMSSEQERLQRDMIKRFIEEERKKNGLDEEAAL